MKEYYEILELQEGATPEEVKRAYFRLIRKYTPEKDPERFQRIREAYEALKDGSGKQEAKQEYELPKDEMAQMFLRFAEESMNRRDYKGAIMNLEAAMEHAPDDPCLLDLMIRIQLRSGHSQKAAKNAERLCVLMPGSRHAWRLQADALYDRGWIKKALPAFRTAYALGEREIDFLNDYTYVLVQNHQMAEGRKVNREILDRDHWDENAVITGINAFCFETLYGNLEGEGLQRFLDEYLAFLKKNRRLITSPDEYLNPFRGMTLPGSQAKLSDRNRLRMVQDALREVEEINPETAAGVKDFLIKEQYFRLEQDKRIQLEYWQYLLGLETNEFSLDDQTRRFAFADTKLCILMEKEKGHDDAMILRLDYPELYSAQRELIDALIAGRVQDLFKKTKRDYDQLAGLFEGGHYQDRYGKRKAQKSQIIDFLTQDSEDPYVREAEKIGRNDPCPCGSGKKFKKCCMGKGIYD